MSRPLNLDLILSHYPNRRNRQRQIMDGLLLVVACALIGMLFAGAL